MHPRRGFFLNGEQRIPTGINLSNMMEFSRKKNSIFKNGKQLWWGLHVWIWRVCRWRESFRYGCWVACSGRAGGLGPQTSASTGSPPIHLVPHNPSCLLHAQDCLIIEYEIVSFHLDAIGNDVWITAWEFKLYYGSTGPERRKNVLTITLNKPSWMSGRHWAVQIAECMICTCPKWLC